MNILVLGNGKTGSQVAQIAAEHGHAVHVCDIADNQHAAALTQSKLRDVDVVIDFTNAEAAVENISAVLSHGGRIVVGTTGWYGHLDEMRALVSAEGALLYGTNFSMGVQRLFRLTAELAKLDGYTFEIDETHHTTKLDSPSGTAITLREIIEQARPGTAVKVTSHRIGDAKGEHIVRATSEADMLELRHDTFSRRGLAEGAVRAAEWLNGRTGCWDFREIFDQL